MARKLLEVAAKVPGLGRRFQSVRNRTEPEIIRPTGVKASRLCCSRLLSNGDDAGLNICLDLQSASHYLVVLWVTPTSFDIALNLQARHNRLIVVLVPITCFDVRFDFHIYLLLSSVDVTQRRQNLGFEDGRSSPLQA